MRVSEQEFLEKSFVSKEPDLDANNAYYGADKKFMKIKYAIKGE